MESCFVSPYRPDVLERYPVPQQGFRFKQLNILPQYFGQPFRLRSASSHLQQLHSDAQASIGLRAPENADMYDNVKIRF